MNHQVRISLHNQWVFHLLGTCIIALLAVYFIYKESESSDLPHYHNDDDIPGVYHDEENI